MARLIIPPLFSVRGKLNIGQAMTLVLSDTIVRYLKQKGEEIFFHSKAYNSQGLPLEKRLLEEKRPLDDNSFFSRAESLIFQIEEDKKRLNLSKDGSSYLDHSPEMRRFSQEVFSKLFSKGYILLDQGEFYLDSPRILRDQSFQDCLGKIFFQPISFFKQLEQISQDVSKPLKISKIRKFATPLPNSSLFLDPLFDLTTQHLSLGNSSPTIQICGRNMATRYILYSLLINFALKGTSHVDSVIVHNILNDSTGRRMSSVNGNLKGLDEIPLKYHNDAVRYAFLRATTFDRETANFDIDFLKEGQNSVYRIGNLRKFFLSHNVSFGNIPLDERVIAEYSRSMDHFDLKKAFDFSQLYLQELSRQIKKEHDERKLSGFREKAVKYKTGTFMAYPFMPEICTKSKELLNF